MIARERTVVITASCHVGYVNEEFASAARPTILAQPFDRGTAAGVPYPAGAGTGAAVCGSPRRLSIA